MKGKIIDGKRVFPFGSLGTLKLEVAGKPWVFDTIIETRIIFKPAPMGGYDGIGNYLKQWRKREGHNQTRAAKQLGVSQSMISKIEKGERSLPLEAFERIRRDNLIYEKDKTATPLPISPDKPDKRSGAYKKSTPH